MLRRVDPFEATAIKNLAFAFPEQWLRREGAISRLVADANHRQKIRAVCCGSAGLYLWCAGAP